LTMLCTGCLGFQDRRIAARFSSPEAVEGADAEDVARRGAECERCGKIIADSF